MHDFLLLLLTATLPLQEHKKISKISPATRLFGKRELYISWGGCKQRFGGSTFILLEVLTERVSGLCGAFFQEQCILAICSSSGHECQGGRTLPLAAPQPRRNFKCNPNNSGQLFFFFFLNSFNCAFNWGIIFFFPPSLNFY